MTSPWQAVVDRAARSVQGGRLPACQLAVARNGELELFVALGEADTVTRFPAYSATKPIVASAVWQLISEGWLQVSSKIGELVPELCGPGMEEVTVEQVLLHTSGFPSAPMYPAEGADTVRRRARFETWRTEWPPGTRFAYHATSAHWVLADLLERADGADFRDVVERRVTGPLGLPRVLGLPAAQQVGIAWPVLFDSSGGRLGRRAPRSGPRSGPGSGPGDGPGAVPEQAADAASFLTSPEALEAGVPGGSGVMTAADLALFYQALLHDPAGLWDPEVLRDVTANVRCTFDDPLMGVPANRTLGLVVAGDDGWHVMRYACFGGGCSPAAFGHAGAHAQVAWADPATGVSFAFLHNAVHPDMRQAGARSVTLSSLVAEAAAG